MALNWGILGAARIAESRVIPAIRAAGGALRAVAGRPGNAARVADFAARHGIATVAPDYDTLLTDPAVDAVYIPLPTGLHLDWARRAVAAGRHVLVEKPFATTPEGVAELGEAARAAGLVLGEAAMYRFHPLHQRAVQLVRDGALGELRWMRAAFSVDLPPDDIRWRRELGGGAMLDLGFYAVGMLRWLCGREPESGAGQAVAAAAGVDARCVFTLSFPDGILGSGAVAMDGAFSCNYEATGSRGRLSVPIGGMCAWPGSSFRIELDGPGGATHETIPPADPYQLMIESFTAAVRDGAPYGVPLEETIANLRAMAAIRLDSQSPRSG